MNPPNDKDLERCVLGAVLWEPDAMRDLLNAGVTSDTFYFPQHGLIFKAFDELHEDGARIDQLTVTNLMNQQGTLDQIGGEMVIASIAGDVTSSANIERHARQLRDLELRRRIQTTATAIASLAEDSRSGNDVFEIMEQRVSAIKEEFKPGPKGMTDRIREFIESTTGNFSSMEVNKILDYSTTVNKRKVSAILCKFIKEGVIERAGDRNGIFRKVNVDERPMDWYNADETTLPVKYPFDIQRWVETMPKNIVLVSGESNSGKTAFLLNMAKLNMDKFDVHYFSSEMGEAELKKRLRLFDTMKNEDWLKVHFYERSVDYADVIRPDAMNIIDFLEVSDEFYRIGGIIKSIFDKLRKGIAIVALQKDPNKTYGRGGTMGLEKPRLYISIRPGECEIVKGKLWATRVNPNGIKCKFKLHNGAHFTYADWIMKEKKP